MTGMTLQELALKAPRASPAPVPAWAIGCFHRRGAAYASGQEDSASQAVRIQAQGLAGWLCIPHGRRGLADRRSLHDCTVDELLDACAADGGVADTAWSNGLLTSSGRSGVQPGDRWPEPLILQRVGPMLVAGPASGAYLEDWRLQPGGSGLLAGLRLMFETGTDGLTRPRDGGLLISGDHGLFTLDRRRPLPSRAPLPQQLRQAGDPYAFAEMAFDGEATYGRRGADGAFTAVLSTHPLRPGRPMPVSHGFSQTSILDILRQEVGEGDQRIVRQWRIDTLIAGVEIRFATACDDAATTGMAQEAQGS